MKRSDWLPEGLAGRFAFAAAGLAAIAVLLISATSWWLITQQQRSAVMELATRERNFHAAAVSSDLGAVHARMTEMANSSILATGLVDSAGKETYLLPFLAGVRQVNGIPVQLLFTDFEGKEIAGNAGARFDPGQLEWLRTQLQSGRPGATITGSGAGAELVAMRPLVYNRTNSPEGALLYKLRIADLRTGAPLDWAAASPHPTGEATPVTVPEDYRALGFVVRGTPAAATAQSLGGPSILQVVAVVAILFALVALAGVRIAGLLTRDLRDLQNFSQEVIGEGLTDRRAQYGGSSEVRGLASSINRMLDRLQLQQQALVDEQAKLTELTDALRTANRRKDEFLAMLAHELRNPLAPLRTGLAVLHRAGGMNAQASRTRELMDRQLTHLVRLVDDLLDVSRVSQGKVVLKKSVHSLQSVVDLALETSRPLMVAASHRLQLALPAQPVLMTVDSTRIAQVLSNILNNAAKYTPHGGEITLRAELASQDRVRIAIQDTGIGIPAEMLESVFELFTQVGAAGGQSQGGLGIGLSLARRLVELHGGSVRAASAGPGQGSTFTIELPVMRPPMDEEDDGQGNIASSVAPRRSDKSILVVDDNADAAESLAMLLEMEGYSVRVEHSGTEALAAAADDPLPDIAILDIGLPDMSGYDLARSLRRDRRYDPTVLVALTGWGAEADQQQARAAGFDVHLTKPVSADDLSKALRFERGMPNVSSTLGSLGNDADR